MSSDKGFQGKSEQFQRLAAELSDPEEIMKRIHAAKISIAQPTGERVLPRNKTEIAIHSIWTDVLGTPDIGVHDDFFILGGHSILGMQVLSRIRNHFDVELELDALFSDTVTIATLAKMVDDKRLLSHSDDSIQSVLKDLGTKSIDQDM